MRMIIKDAQTGRPLNFSFDYTNVMDSSSVDSSVPEQWSTEIEDYVKPRRLMERFVVEKTELISKPGDTINITKMAALTASGDLTETTSLEDNLEKFSITQVQFSPAERGNGIGFTGQAAAKTILEMRNESVKLLGDWAKTKIDNDIHTSMRNNVGASRILYGGDATNSLDLDSSDKFLPALVEKAEAKLRGAKIPRFDMSNQDDPSAKNDGYYVCLAHSYQLYDFKQDSDYQTARNDVGYLAAAKNVPAKYQGFDIVWGKVLIYDTDQIAYTDQGVGYSVKTAKAFIFGPRAMGRAHGIFKLGPGFIWNEESYDLGRALAIAVRWYDQVKPLNTERLYGLYTAATDLS